MTISEAQKISITGYLASIGIEPQNLRGDDVWYCSPLRAGETKASFKVNTRINRWKDFGSDGKGGDLIDLICRMNNVSVTGALLILAAPEIASNNTFSFRGEVSEETSEGKRLKIKRVQHIQNRLLMQYLETRRISVQMASRFCREVYYTILHGPTETKQFFSIGLQNDSGGWALRNMFVKNQSSPQDITTIKGTTNTILSVFEGFFDFLSACQYYQVPKPAGTVIILNSTVNLEKVFPVLGNFEKICSYLDNDNSGRKATAMIRERHSRVTNYSEVIYPDHKDFNEFLMNSKDNKIDPDEWNTGRSSAHHSGARFLSDINRP